jgi:hypothetical protein
VLGLPGIYLAWLVATLDCVDYEISNGVCGNPPIVARSPLGKHDADNLSSPSSYVIENASSRDAEKLKEILAGSGENQSKKPSTEPQEREGFLPVETPYDIKYDTKILYKDVMHTEVTEIKDTKFKDVMYEELKSPKTKHPRENDKREIHVIGYVPIEIVNLSLEERGLPKNLCVGLASPTELCEGTEQEEILITTGMASRLKDERDKRNREFEIYVTMKLEHLSDRDRDYLEPVLLKYSHLFYQEGSRVIGCTEQVKHKINTGDANPMKKKTLSDSTCVKARSGGTHKRYAREG